MAQYQYPRYIDILSIYRRISTTRTVREEVVNVGDDAGNAAHHHS